MPQPTIKAQVGNQIYQATESQCRAFAQAWDVNGIKMVLDNTTITFATTFANIVLRSCIEDPAVQKHIFGHVLAQIKAAKAAAAAPAGEAPAPEQAPAPAPEPPAPAKSSIILTDC
jgi:hypothetical protein